MAFDRWPRNRTVRQNTSFERSPAKDHPYSMGPRLEGETCALFGRICRAAGRATIHAWRVAEMVSLLGLGRGGVSRLPPPPPPPEGGGGAGYYFADFFCVQARLAIEVDGPSHAERQ